MQLKENYSGSPRDEYSRHYSAESEYPKRQNKNSKSGEEQKKVTTSADVLISKVCTFASARGPHKMKDESEN